MSRPVRMLFVCMGNICRSPTAEGVMTKLLLERNLTAAFELDSAGTHAYHVGQPPDDRAVAAARLRGVELAHLRARQINVDDFYRFDHVLAMDDDNLQILNDLKPADATAQVSLLLRYSKTNPHGAVPDPYYGGAVGFERVLDMLEEVSEELLAACLDR